jgi:hypothetical protein
MIVDNLYTRKRTLVQNNLCEFTELEHKFKLWFYAQKRFETFGLKISGIQE